MKSNVLKNVLEWALIAILILSVFFSVKYYFKSKQQRRYGLEAMQFEGNTRFLNALLGESVDYARRDPGIIPVLEGIGVSRNMFATPSSAPAGAPAKPGGK